MIVPGREVTPAGWLGACLYSEIRVKSKDIEIILHFHVLSITKFTAWMVHYPCRLEETSFWF